MWGELTNAPVKSSTSSAELFTVSLYQKPSATKFLGLGLQLRSTVEPPLTAPSLQCPFWVLADSPYILSNFNFSSMATSSKHHRSLKRVFTAKIRILCKTRRQQQREDHQTNGLTSKTMGMHVHYNSWYISLPSSAKQ